MMTTKKNQPMTSPESDGAKTNQIIFPNRRWSQVIKSHEQNKARLSANTHPAFGLQDPFKVR
jgi:hypothetical protein